MNGLEPRYRLSPLLKPDREQILRERYYTVADENTALVRKLARIRAVADWNEGDGPMRQILNILDEA